MTTEPEIVNEWDIDSFDWPFNGDDPGEHRVIVEVGGFEGRWVSEMAHRYRGEFHVFEPQPWSYRTLRERFHARTKPSNLLLLHRYALGLHNKALEMRGWGTDANSFLKDAAFYERHPEEGRRESGVGEMRDVHEVWQEKGWDQPDAIDVLCMNIEGYEFVLLPYMSELGLLESIRFLMVQFHDGYDVLVDERFVRDLLSRTHDIRWDHGSTLVCFERKTG